MADECIYKVEVGKSVVFLESSIHKTMFEARVVTISKVLGARDCELIIKIIKV